MSQASLSVSSSRRLAALSVSALCPGSEHTHTQSSPRATPRQKRTKYYNKAPAFLLRSTRSRHTRKKTVGCHRTQNSSSEICYCSGYCYTLRLLSTLCCLLLSAYATIIRLPLAAPLPAPLRTCGRRLQLYPDGRVPPQLRVRRVDLAPALCAKRVPAAAAGAPHIRSRTARLAADGGRGGGAQRERARSTRHRCRYKRRSRLLGLHRVSRDGWQRCGDASSRARYCSMVAEAGICPHRRVCLAPAASAKGHILAAGAPDVREAAAD